MNDTIGFMERLLTIAEVANLIARSTTTVRQADSFLQPIRFGPRQMRLYDPERVSEWIALRGSKANKL